MKFHYVFAGAVATFLATAAFAQPTPSGFRGFDADPAAQLSANLVVLSQNPRDVNALIGAGQSAVAVGDGNAALAFLARAEEISPRNGRIKAALGSALLLLERPGEALKLFSEASALGIPDSDIAADRGLAHDLKGESRKAQRDYLLAQRIEPSDELTRRLALSYGISGDRSNALSMLDPLLRKQDQAAWRARAFILAMTGDIDDAEEIARTVMPAGIGNGMRPFLRRLATLSPADRAMAVNFGTMPGDGTRLASSNPNDGYANQAGRALIPAGDVVSPRDSDVAKPPAKLAVTREPRRRPGVSDSAPVWNLAASLPNAPRSSAAPSSLANDPLAPPSRRVEERLTPAVAERPQPDLRSGSADVAALDTKTVVPPANDRTQANGVAVAVPVAGAAAIVASRPQVPTLSASEPSPVYEVPASPVLTVVAVKTEGNDAPSAGAISANSFAPPLSAPTPQSFRPDAKPGFTDNASAMPVAASVIVGNSPPDQPTALAASGGALVAAPPAVATPAIMDSDRGSQAVASFAKIPSPAVATPLPDLVKASASTGLAGIIASIEPEAETVAAPLPTAAELRAARQAQQKKAAALAKVEADAKTEKNAKDAAKREAAKHPARIWVQVATGANEAGLPTTWKRIRDKSPAMFKGMSAASVPFKATNRLLVGPFKSQAEARALVNAMQKSGMAGTTYSSEAGQDIARIAGK